MKAADIDVEQLCEYWAVGRYETDEGYVISIARPGVQFAAGADKKVTISIDWLIASKSGVVTLQPLAVVTRSYGVLGMSPLHARVRWYDWGDVSIERFAVFWYGMRLARLIHVELQRNVT